MHVGDIGFCNYLYQGQTIDRETGLAYNRFRYYDSETGNYISQYPIGLAGDNSTLYGYVSDTNNWVDVFGLDCSKPKKSQYSVWHEMELDGVDFGKSRPTHFRRANKSLLEAMDADLNLKKHLEAINPNIVNEIKANPGLSPSGFVWHHAHSSTAGGKQGIMQLVPKSQHTGGSEFWSVMHPNNKGGYHEWGIPNGAPKN